MSDEPRKIIMGWMVIQGPAQEPVTLAELEKEFGGAVAPDLAVEMISAARSRAEVESGSAVGEQTIRMTLNRFPLKSDEDGLVFILLSWPIGEITRFEYLDTAGQTVKVKKGEYSLDLSVRPARVEPAVGAQYWPLSQHRVNAVTLEYTTGAPASDGMKMAIRMIAAYLVKNKDVVLPNPADRFPIPMAAAAILEKIRMS